MPMQEIFPPENSCNVPLKDRPVISINEVILSDSVLISELSEMEMEVSQKDSLFNSGMGVLEVYTYYSYDSDVLRRYYITPQYVDIKRHSGDISYPLYYAMLGKRLVIIYPNPLPNMICYRLSEKSKKSLERH